MTPAAQVIANLTERGLLVQIKLIVTKRHVTLEEACGRGRYKHVADVRHACWIHLRGLGFSYPEIGRIWLVDHTTVLVACRNKS